MGLTGLKAEGCGLAGDLTHFRAYGAETPVKPDLLEDLCENM
jgi:hypothetical protein